MAYINGWSLKRAEQIAEEAFGIFEEQAERNWLLGYHDQCVWYSSVELILKSHFRVIK